MATGQYSRYVRPGDHYLNVTGEEHELQMLSKEAESDSSLHAITVSSGGNYDYPDGTGVQTNAFISEDGHRTVVIQNKIHNNLVVQVGTVVAAAELNFLVS